MPTPILALNTIDGTTPQVRRYLGATVVTQGVSFGSLDTGFTGTVSQKMINRVTQFGNASTLVATTGTGIYRSTNSGQSWSLVHTFSPAIATNQMLKTGIHQISLNGVPTLCMAYQDSSNNWRGVTSTNGSTWTNVGSSSAMSSPGNPGPFSEVVYRNKLYWCMRNVNGGNGQICVFDPGASNISAFNANPAMKTGGVGEEQSGASLVEWNGNLYVFYLASNDNITLGLIMGATTSTVATFGNFPGTSTETGMSACFIDGANFYGFIGFHVSTGLRAFQCTPAFAASTISGTVLPVGLSGLTTTVRCTAHVDSESSIGSNPTKYLYIVSDASSVSSYSMFRWNGNSSVMTLTDIGGSSTHALSRAMTTSGNEFFTADSNTIEIVTRAAVAGGLRFSFKLYSASGAATVDVNGYYGTSTDEYDTTQANLSSPSSGIMSGNTITGLTADNGLTTYQVTWDALDNGISPGDYYRFVFSVSA